MTMVGRRAIVGAFLGISLAVACTPKARPTSADHGVATSETWVELSKFGTRVQVPPGWQFAQKSDVIASFSKDGRGGFSMAGASSKADAKEQLAIGLQELDIELGLARGAPHDIEVHGIVFARQDFEATVHGERAHVVVLAADAPPKGKGIVVFIGYAFAGDEPRREGLRASIASLTPG